MTPLGAHIWISFSPDLRHWGNHKLMLDARRRGARWEANKIGMSSSPIETPRGWLMIYYGVRRTPSSSIYRPGPALSDLPEPGKCLIRGDSWIFAPETEYERHGDVPDVVFPLGIRSHQTEILSISITGHRLSARQRPSSAHTG
jgi:predicted GH43/DUF377 family glycosyl hydrolase